MLERFELELVRRSAPDFAQNLRIVEALYQEAVLLGVLPRPDPLEGIEAKVRLARALNRV